jgi:tetratricopeptide (TPR) repeat protein
MTGESKLTEPNIDWNGIFRHAIELCKQGKLQQALSIHEKLIERFPDNAALHKNLGGLLQQLEQPLNSIAAFRLSLSIDNNQPDAHFHIGTVLSSIGRHQESIAHYEQALALKPDYPDAHNNLGIVLSALGRDKEAIEHFGAAIAAKPDYAEALSNLGNTMAALRRFEEAVNSYDAALRIRPDLAEIYSNRGVALRALRRLDEALASFDEALRLRPDHADTYLNKGNTLNDLGLHEEAAACYEAGLQIKPDHAEALSNCGLVLHSLKRYEEALARFEAASRIEPEDATFHFNYANTQLALKHYEEAVASYELAIRIRPNYVEAHSNRGVALHRLRQIDMAISAFNTAIKIDPGYAEAYSNRGNSLKELRQYNAAIASYDAALAIKPNMACAYSNRGLTLHENWQLEDALSSFDMAIRADPEYALAYWNKSLVLLLCGRLQEGWPFYEWRFKAQELNMKRRDYPQPLLINDNINGKTIFIYHEQGLGDMIQFCRYASLLRSRGAHVILEVQAPLATIIRTLSPDIMVLPSGARIPQFDYHVPLLSLPHIFNTSLKTIPASIPYLSATKEKMEYWKHKLGEKKGLRVGLVWSGGLQADQPELWEVNPRRNIPLEALAPLNLPGMEFFSLQKGEEAVRQLRELEAQGWDGPAIVDYTDELNDFDDTAALVENLDLVISVDTSTAHLAGSLGIPVWILNRYDNCWRWLQHRTDSPWYPTATLFRQPSAGDWASVIASVKLKLEQLAAKMPA